VTTSTATYREAVRSALRKALSDPRAFLMGEDVVRYGGAYAVSAGLLDELGPERIRDTPLSESAFVGAGVGAALGGMRPIVEVMTVNFSLLALDQLVNGAAALRHMSGGQLAVPLVVRMATGAGRQLAAQHSHSLENWYAHVPGLKVLAPGTVQDARDALLAAFEEPDPVIVFEHQALYNTEGSLDDEAPFSGVWRATVLQSGSDVSLITYGGCVPKVLQAAAALKQGGISAEVLDLRCLRPLDKAAILGSVARTHRVVVVEECWKTGGLAAEILAVVVEGAFYELDAPPERVASAEVPIPYPKHLEDAALPSVERIVDTVRKVVPPHG
jgi:pyruvate dehydrogenase E1 component beta subunit